MKEYDPDSSYVEPISRRFLLWSWLLFMASLFMPRYYTMAGTQVGILDLVYGVFGFFMGAANACWLANPLLFIAWGTSKNKTNYSLFCSLCAIAIALLFLNANQVSFSPTETISGYGIGYYFWVASMLVMLIGSLIRKRVRIDKTNTESTNNS